MVEPEPMKKLTKKDQLLLDEELDFKLQAKEEEEERHAREKAQQIKEANIFSWDNKLFDKAMKRVNTFVDMETELMEGSEVRAEVEIAQESSSKRAGIELEQKSIKKQKVDED
ncbi:hypothetical protein Tco_0083489 [Tanacetum coccineum]